MLEKDNDLQILALFVAFLQKVTSAYVLPLRRPHFDIRSTVGARILSLLIMGTHLFGSVDPTGS